MSCCVAPLCVLRCACLLVRLGHSGGVQQRSRAGAGGRGVAPLRRRRAARRASAGGKQVGTRDSATTENARATQCHAKQCDLGQMKRLRGPAREAERQRSARQATLIMWRCLPCACLSPCLPAACLALFSDILINHTDGYTTAIARSSNLKEALQQQQQQAQAQAGDEQPAAGPAEDQ